MLNKEERYLITVLQGRTESSGPNAIPAEFRSEPKIDLSKLSTQYEVKALMNKLGKNLPVFRQVMSGTSKWSDVFQTNVNQILLDIAAAERIAEAKKK